MNQNLYPTASYRQRAYWVRRGLLRPVEPRPGSGNTRQWSEEERQTAQIMARLVDAGLTPQAASKVAHGQLLLAPGVWVVVNP